MNMLRIELYFFLATGCSNSRKTRQTPLLTWTWNSCFYFVDMKRKVVGGKMALKRVRAAIRHTCVFMFPLFDICVRGCGNNFKCIEEGGVEMKLQGERHSRRTRGDKVRKRKVGARLSPSNLPPSLQSEIPSVASCCSGELRRASMWHVGSSHLNRGMDCCRNVPAYVCLLPLLENRGSWQIVQYSRMHVIQVIPQGKSAYM